MWTTVLPLTLCLVYSTAVPIISEWDVLAPFPYGYRQQGGDPLARWGGITGIPRADNSTYPSELVNGGRAFWSKATAQDGTVQLGDFPHVNWTYLGVYYGFGFAGQLWQGWALSDFSVTVPGVYLLNCVDGDFTQTFTQSLAFIDDNPIEFNTGAYNWGYWPVQLSTGKHTLRVHVSGQANSEKFTCKFVEAAQSSSSGKMAPFMILADTLTPSLVDGIFQGEGWVAVCIVNQQDTVWLSNVHVKQVGPTGAITLKSVDPLSPLAPGQAGCLNLLFESAPGHSIGPTAIIEVELSDSTTAIPYNFTLHNVANGKPFVFTFKDADNSVAYAAAYPPMKGLKTGAPVLLTLHGADVVAASGAWVDAYHRQDTAWILYPTNRRRLGYDWQGPGRINMELALTNLVAISKTYNQPDVAVNPQLLVYAGHSMGGHGCLIVSTHYPDPALGTAPAAGWISWPLYVPMFLRVGRSSADPTLTGLLEASIAENGADLYSENVAGIPAIVRMGGNDRTVPPWNLFRTARKWDEWFSSVNWTQVSEIPGKGHWFNGVVDDKIMQKFFDDHLLNPKLPPLPKTFSLQTINPASSGSRGYLSIVQLLVPFRTGRIKVHQTSVSEWTIKTHNVQRFKISGTIQPGRPLPTVLIVEGEYILVHSGMDTYVCMNPITRNWTVCNQTDYTVYPRAPSQYGPVRQFMEGAPLVFIVGTQQENMKDVFTKYAVWAANDYYMTGRYTVEVVMDTDVDISSLQSKNVLLFGGRSQNSITSYLQTTHTFPITIQSGGSLLVRNRVYSGNGLGTIFLFPNNATNLGAVLYGTDMAGFLRATKLIPTHTAQTVPDFLIVGEEWDWGGDNYGILAAGYYGNDWAVSPQASWLS